MPDSSNDVDFTWPKELENNKKSNKEKGLGRDTLRAELLLHSTTLPQRENSLLLDCTCPCVNVEEKNVFTKAERVQECFRRQSNKDIIAITLTGEFKACVLYPKSEGNSNLNCDRETWKVLDVQRFKSAEDVEIVTNTRIWKPTPLSRRLVNYLYDNEVGDGGAKSLASVLQISLSLEVVGLEGNQIGDAGAQHLAKSLTENKTLAD